MQLITDRAFDEPEFLTSRIRATEFMLCGITRQLRAERPLFTCSFTGLRYQIERIS